MRRRWAKLILLVSFAGLGCHGADKRRDDDGVFSGPDRPGATTGGKKDRAAIDVDSPAHWLDRPKPDFMKGSTPNAPSWNSPKDPNYDLKSETNGMLSGYVEDPDGRKLGNVFVEVREVGDTNTKPIGVVSLAGGAFTVLGLKPNRNYQLSVSANVEGRKLFQSVYTKTPNPNVRLTLLEGEGAAIPMTPAPSAPALDPLKKSPTNAIPAPFGGTLPAPDFGTRGSGVAPTGGYEVPPSSGPLPDRSDLTTDRGGNPWKSPVAEIPKSSTPLPEGRRESRKGESKELGGLLDGSGTEAKLPAANYRLIAFLETTNPKAASGLNELNRELGGSKFGIVGVLCDEGTRTARLNRMAQFEMDQKVEFPLRIEADLGGVAKRFGISRFPMAVLLDSNGGVIWQGDPSDAKEIQEAMKAGR